MEVELNPPTEDGWDLLGGLRFAMAIIVVAVHCEAFDRQSRPVMLIAKFGALPAILCFLVVSGYSIAHSVTQRPAGFYMRRFRRIYPLYLIAVFAGLWPEYLIFGLGSHSAKTLFSNLLFLQTFRTHAVPGNPVTWTLAVEAACYGVAPLLICLRTSCLIILTLLSATAYVAYGFMHLKYYGDLLHGLPLLFLAWSWLIGFIFYRLRGHRAAATVLISVMSVLTTLNPKFMEPLSMLTIVLGMAVIGMSPFITLPTAIRRVLRFLGDLSYPLYLFHAPLLIVYHEVHHGQSQWFVVFSSIVLSAVMLAVDSRLRGPVTWVCKAIAEGLSRGAKLFKLLLSVIDQSGGKNLIAIGAKMKMVMVRTFCLPELSGPEGSKIGSTS